MSDLLFTRPAMLWGLFAAALPVIIHLINRHRARRHPFAAIDFLLRVQRRAARRILMRHILLLTARTMLIVTLVLAAAGPVLQPSQTTTVEGRAATVMIVDRSLSMRTQPGDQSWFAAAIDRARNFVQGMAPGDQACLVAAGLHNQALIKPCTDSPGILLDALDSLESEWGISNLTEAMEQAASLLANTPGPNRRVLLLTDGAAHAFHGAPRWPLLDDPPEVVLQNIAPNVSRDNHAVSTVEQNDRGPYLEVTARFTSFSHVDQNNLPTEVSLGVEALARGFVDLPAAATVSKLFNIRAPSTPNTLGKIVLKPDRLPFDDQRIFFVSDRRRVNALLVNGDMRPVLHQDELFYLEHALSPAGEEASGISFSTITPERFQADSLENIDVVFLANVPDLSPDAASALRSFVSAGGGLFLSLGNQVEVDRTNGILDEMLPLPLRDIVALGLADLDGVHRKGIAFSDFEIEHPVLSLFRGDETRALKAIRTWKAAVLEPGQAGNQAKVLLSYANGSPALVEGSYQNGRVMLFTSSLDRDWTSWPARASFLPFLQRVTSYLAGRLSRLPPLEVTVGSPARIPLAPKAGSLQIIRPDGVKIAPAPGDAGEGMVVFSDTTVPGWYQVQQTTTGGKPHGRTPPGVIVHLPPLESDLRTLPAEELQALLGQHAKLTLAGAAGDLTRSRSSTFLVLTLLLALAEAFLVRR